MKKSYMYAIVLVVIVVAAGVVGYVASHKTTNSYSNMNMGSSSSSSSQTPVATDIVTIQNYAFSPANITVKKGSVVTWTNKDSVAHTVTETDSLTGPSSGDVAPGSSYSFTFSATGTYHYHCSIHPSMVGTVTVTN